MKAKLLKADDTEVEIEPANGKTFNLDELRGYVGGYIEIHTMSDGQSMIMNEEATLLNMPINEQATIIAYHLFTISGIQGDVVLCDATMIE